MNIHTEGNAHEGTNTRKDIETEEHIHGRTYIWRSIHMEGYIYGRIYTRRDIITQISIRSPKNQPRRKTPPSFWDNLSRQVLVPRALKEFDRRTIKYHPPIPPQPSSLGSGRNYGDLKRFARLGGPSLADLRGVRFISHLFQ